jgi:hypothetical protein
MAQLHARITPETAQSAILETIPTWLGRNFMLIGYARVSTEDRDTKRQTDSLEKAGCKCTSGWCWPVVPGVPRRAEHGRGHALPVDRVESACSIAQDNQPVRSAIEFLIVANPVRGCPIANNPGQRFRIDDCVVDRHPAKVGGCSPARPDSVTTQRAPSMGALTNGGAGWSKTPRQ